MLPGPPHSVGDLQPSRPRLAVALRAPLRGAAARYRRAVARYGLAGCRRPCSFGARQSAGGRLVRRSIADSRAGRARLVARLRSSRVGRRDSGARAGDRRLLLRRVRNAGRLSVSRESRASEDAPQDWDDLLDPKWTGKIIIRDPLASGTMRAVFGFIIERGLNQTGDTAAGFAWLRRLDGQTKAYEQNPALVSERIARQEGLLTVWDLPDVLISRRRGMPIGYVFPKSGTVAIEDGIAVVRGAKHLAAARGFVDFVGSPEMQLAAAREVYRLPARLDLPADSLPDWVRDVRRRMVVADVDWNLLAEHGPEWMRWWDQHVRGTGHREGSRH